MTDNPKCQNEKCPNDATLQVDHVGTLVLYCENCWGKYKRIMEAIGSPVGTAYPVGTLSK